MIARTSIKQKSKKYSKVVGGVLSPTHDAYQKSSLIPASHRLEMARSPDTMLDFPIVDTRDWVRRFWREGGLLFNSIAYQYPRTEHKTSADCCK